MNIRLKAALQGDLAAHLAAEKDLIARAVTAGVRRAARGLEKDWEKVVTDAGLGRLARAVDSKVYPRGRDSLGAAGLVYVKGGARTSGAMIAFSEGASITARGGRYLAIPTGYNKARGRRNAMSGGALVTPREMAQSKLAFVLPVANGVRLWCLKVVRSQTKDKNGHVVDRAHAGGMVQIGSGRRKRVAAALGRGFVPMFILVPKVRLSKRFSLDGLAETWGGEVVRLIAAEFNSTAVA